MTQGTLYNFLTAAPKLPERIPAALREIFDVPQDSIDVSPQWELEFRNWDALVSCEYESREGDDLQWAMSIYVTEDVEVRPREQDVAMGIAKALRAPVLFPEGQTVPSVWGLAQASGEFTHARLHEPEDEDEVLTVVEVEKPVPEFPNATVIKFSDIVWEVRFSTPLTDSHLGDVDGEVDVEFREKMENWERLIKRMAAGWPPSNWYPADMYKQNLCERDEAQQLVYRLSSRTRGPALSLMEALDAQFTELTVDDGGAALVESQLATHEHVVQAAWYWRRRPTVVPWTTD